MNHRGYLYLPVEVKVRELDAKLLLAYYAIKSGYQVIIGEHRMVESAAKIYPQGIFFSKGYPRGLRKRVLLNASNHGHKIVELDEEGFMFNDTTRYLHDRMNSRLLHLITQEYCWGDVQKRAIAKADSHRLHQKLHITGHPRFDLLKPKFNLLYQDDVKHLRKKYGCFILINTRFAAYNFLNKKSKNQPESFTAYFKDLYDSFIEMVEYLSQQYRDTHFIVRPHPSENFNSYREAFAAYDNVHVIHEGNIIKWLKAAAVVIHNSCTSSIEAYLLGKPIISYMPVTSRAYDVGLPNDLGVKAANIREIHMLLERLLTHTTAHHLKSQQTAENRRQLSHYYTNVGLAYESIVHLLQNIPLPSSSNPAPPSQTIKTKEHATVKHFFDVLTKKDIQNFFSKLNKIENSHRHMLIEKLGNNLFKIKANVS